MCAGQMSICLNQNDASSAQKPTSRSPTACAKTADYTGYMAPLVQAKTVH